MEEFFRFFVFGVVAEGCFLFVQQRRQVYLDSLMHE